MISVAAETALLPLAAHLLPLATAVCRISEPLCKKRKLTVLQNKVLYRRSIKAKKILVRSTFVMFVFSVNRQNLNKVFWLRFFL